MPFPGIGYTCDKPLLYYSAKMLRNNGYQVCPVLYTGFPKDTKGDAAKMQQAVLLALEQTETALEHIDWKEYEYILFVSKSIGTVVGSVYSLRHSISCRHILFTPVEAAFQFAGRRSIAFHGTADPWADTAAVEEACRVQGIPLYETEGANHSLEMGNVIEDIETIKKTMKIVEEYVTGM